MALIRREVYPTNLLNLSFVVTLCGSLIVAVPNATLAQTATLERESAAAEPAATNQAADAQAQSLARLTRDIKYLASDELGGRQPGTPEMLLAEAFIIEQYEAAGVAAGGTDGSYRQVVPVAGQRTVDPAKTRMTLTGPDDQVLKLSLGESFAAMTTRKPSSLVSPLVFVGYGITAAEHNYDDYRDVDVQGRVVVLIRREPQQTSADSVFGGMETTQYSYVMLKVQAARKAGAVGVIFVNDRQTAATVDQDQLVAAGTFGSLATPFFQITRATFDALLEESPLISPLGQKLATLSAAEDWIDERLEPISQPLGGWSIDAAVDFNTPRIDTANLIAVIEGQGELAEETVIVGAHYDHLGMGAYGSRTPQRKEIHNGADDNATGTAAVLELARRFAAADPSDQPRRRLVLICFTAEEMGLLGALHYVAEPTFELKQTVAMVNFDMIGWLREDKVTIYNWNTSPQFGSLLERANEDVALRLVKPAAAFAGSDHLPFNQKQIPNMFIHTGITDTYHTPDDTFETIDCDGVCRVVDYSENVLEALLTGERAMYGLPKRFRLGLNLSREGTADGVAITGVVAGSIAEKAGLKPGDVVMAYDGDVIAKRRQLVRRVRRDRGNTITLKIRRGDEEMDFDIELMN